jgi:hypothetical protein
VDNRLAARRFTGLSRKRYPTVMSRLYPERVADFLRRRATRPNSPAPAAGSVPRNVR